MLLVEPPPSQGDLHFRVFGIPVRVHPYFWLVTLIFALQGNSTPPAKVLIWIVAVFVSILIHELGHALFQMRYGGHPRIILYGMGGLAACEDCDRSTRSQILISLAGPGAGFLLAMVVLFLLQISGHEPGIAIGSGSQVSPPWISILGAKFHWFGFRSLPINLLVGNLLWINILWGAVNLLPIYPLDGGHISRELCVLSQPRQGIVLSLQISVACGILMAIVGLFWRSFFVTLLFGYLAYSSFRTLRAYRSYRD